MSRLCGKACETIWWLVGAGAILTKMDGDSRGGAALSIKAVSGKPIKFVGTGERMEALEPFYPDRIASRILGAPRMLPNWELGVFGSGCQKKEINTDFVYSFIHSFLSIF